MKKLLLLIYFFAVTCSAITVLAEDEPTVKQQLDKLNKCWLDKHFDDAVLKERISLNDDVSLIRMHLRLVEKKLREADTQSLSSNQLSKRNQCLEILHSYCERGVFPKNLYHKERTPYFIDKFGTACAVGQLIISTRYEALAKKISAENNYAYISELNVKYPELKMWADEYGFGLDELAWIQPTYGSCDVSCNNSATISVSNAGIPPFTYQWNTGQTTAIITGLCPFVFYTCMVIDSVGDTITNIGSGAFVYVLGIHVSGNSMYSIGSGIQFNALEPIEVDLSSSIDDGSCNGTATALASYGPRTYYYSWTPGGQTTQTATGLCSGMYTVRVFPGGQIFGCDKTDSVFVDLQTDVDIFSGADVVIYPNPATDKLSISGYRSLGNAVIVEMYNALGEKVFQSSIIKPKYEIDISSLAEGVYLVQVYDGEKTVRTKVVVKRL